MNLKMMIMVSILLLPMNSLLGMQTSKSNGGNVIRPCMALAGVVVAGLSFKGLYSLMKDKKALKNMPNKLKALAAIENTLQEMYANSHLPFVDRRDHILKQEDIILGPGKAPSNTHDTRLGLAPYRDAALVNGQPSGLGANIRANNNQLIQKNRGFLAREQTDLEKKHAGILTDKKKYSKRAWQLSALGAFGICVGATAVFTMITRK